MNEKYPLLEVYLILKHVTLSVSIRIWHLVLIHCVCPLMRRIYVQLLRHGLGSFQVLIGLESICVKKPIHRIVPNRVKCLRIRLRLLIVRWQRSVLNLRLHLKPINMNIFTRFGHHINLGVWHAKHLVLMWLIHSILVILIVIKWNL